MAFLGNLMQATGAAVSAFRETMLNADPQAGRSGMAFDPGSWDRWGARQVRYDLYWSLYQNQAYRDLVHPWAATFKTSYGTYKHIRHIYNPAYRIGEFWAGHLMGGLLDPLAGDGKATPSALPIATANEAVRPGIARLWRDSRWQVHKDLYARWGAVLADVGLKGVADPEKKHCRMEVVHPGHLKWVDRDECGEVRGYILQKWVPDPRDADIRDASPTVDPQSSLRRVIYYEKCYLDGEDVVYQTYLDNELQEEWSRPYGFVPLEVVGHEAIGLDWGQNCFHSGLSRFLEVDDQASCLGDQNRRVLRAPVLVAGAKGPAELRAAGADRAARSPQQNLADPEPARSEQVTLYSPSPETKVHSLLGKMDDAGVTAHIASILADMERMFPELLADTGSLAGTVTAEAIRNARQVSANRVQAKRPGYDDPLARLQKKMLAVGGIEGFPGYEGYGLDAYRAGTLDHSIAHRPVFELDPVDKLQEDALLWGNATAARAAGVPLTLFLARNGWSESDLAELEAAIAAEPQPQAVINLTTPRPGEPEAGAGI